MAIESIEFRRLNGAWVMGLDDHARDHVLTGMERTGAILVSTAAFKDGDDSVLVDTFRKAGE